MSSGADTLVALAASVLPVLAFLASLTLLDTYRLLSLRFLLGIVAAGVAASLFCWGLQIVVVDAFALSDANLIRYVAPPMEEIVKAAIVVALLVRNRTGFLVDAAIAGFAVGAGFAVIENLNYLGSVAQSGIGLWVVRGFGTAIMHGGVTALMAVVSRHLADRHGSASVRAYVPGIALAVAAHGLYNQFYLSPRWSTVGLLVVLPAVFLAVFVASERATRNWLGTGFDTDSELLGLIRSGQAGSTRVGSYLASLREHFPPAVLVDMMCLVVLQLELSIQAKGVLLARENGLEIVPSRDVKEKLEELTYLERSIGRAGRMAMAPIFNMSSRDLWQVYFLRSS